MQLAACMCILALSLAVFYILGKALCIRLHWNVGAPEMLCAGFFLYFALFQIVAEIMIFAKQKLHVLGRVWLVFLILLLGASIFVLYSANKKDKNQNQKQYGKVRPALFTRFLLFVMAAAIVCECLTAVLLQRSMGWDFAYYIGNMSTSVLTDTMYLFDGSSGFLRKHMELRYALSAFYMNTAWISQITAIPVLLLQKYVMGVLCVLLTNFIVYSFAMEVFSYDRGKSAMLVTLTIVMTTFWDVYDTSGQFLMIRSYEAKAYCANVVLPMAVYVLYRIWKDDKKRQNWEELFLIMFASIAVSMSSLLIVPALLVIMCLAHILAGILSARQLEWAFVRKAVFCLIPNICYLAVYFLYSSGLLVVEV